MAYADSDVRFASINLYEEKGVTMTRQICNLSIFILAVFLTITGASADYTFESIEVPGVDFLELTASSDFEDYAGNTLSADGEKTVAFTLIDGVFNTYDFPGSKNTYFYALGNDGSAAGHYEDSDGLHHGVILENGELRQYDFPDAVQTEIYGISDATGALTGNFIDASGVRRGFSGDLSLEFPGAVATYADFVNASGVIVGSYIDSAGIYHAYGLLPNGRFVAADILTTSDLEFLFVHGLNDINVIVARSKVVDDVPRTYVGIFGGIEELRFPGSVSTEGWNINQDSSVVGNYVTADGHRHGFIAKPVMEITQDTVAPPIDLDYTFERVDVPGVDFLELTANNDFGDYAGSTRSADGEKMVGFTLIDGVFNTYDFPGSNNTYFYALGNDGTAAGYYEDNDGLHHGVILENGELRRYDFPDAAETFIYGVSDETGALTGSWIDASGVRRGFTGDTIIEGPGATATYAYSVNTHGEVVGSYVNPEGLYHAFIRSPDNKYTSPPTEKPLEFAFFHQINDAGIYVGRSKAVGDVPRTYVGTLYIGSHELQFPDSVGTHGWDINQDGSVVGYYDTADGRRQGFIARTTGDDVPLQPILPPIDPNYTFERIDVPGVDFLELTASSDFEDYAGYTVSADGEKIISFTLIDGVFETYDFPGSTNTYFYALGNDGTAAGYYEDSDGLHHGIILENGELRQYDFPDAVQTEIYGISDATGALTGNFIDATGVRRGFTGDTIIEFPGATATYADFVSAGRLVGSYIDAEGIYHAYIRPPNNQFTSIDVPDAANLDYYFVHGINDAGTYVARAQVSGDIPRTYVGTFTGREELRFPGSVSTEGYNINQDGSIVGNYDTPDGRRHGFIARPAVDDRTIANVTGGDWTYESIEVAGVDFLELTASSDFEDYAGNTRSADGEKIVGFTLIDGVFTTYDFPGSQHTYFYALGNDGIAAGHYQDSEGLHHGVILEGGELRQYDFPGAVETFIYGISDATGVLTGNFIDASGIRRGFSGEIIIEYPGAVATYADFVNARGLIAGSYIDAEGVYHAYVRTPDGSIHSVDFAQELKLEYLFVHGLSDAGTSVSRVQESGDIPRTYVNTLAGREELRFPGSVSTEGWNINQDSSVVGYYDTPDGRRHGFIARPAVVPPAEIEPPVAPTHLFEMALAKGLNMISLPLMPLKPYTARSFAEMLDATVVIRLDTHRQEFVGFTANQSGEGYPIEGGQGYIVNVPGGGTVTFEGTAWSNTIENTAAAPGAELSSTGWAFVVSGDLHETVAGASYTVVATNRRTGEVAIRQVTDNDSDFNVVWADLSRQPVIESGDTIEIALIDQSGTIVSGPFRHQVGVEDLQKAYVSLSLTVGDVHPTETLLGQNFPNPFNPETWIPYQLESSADVVLHIYDTSGRIVRTIDLGFKPQGFYMTRSTAAYWDGRNNIGEQVASGVYFYSLNTPDFSATRKMLILK